MQKKLFLLAIFLFGFLGLQAQWVADTSQSIGVNASPIEGYDYGNDWYRPGIPWVKFKVVEDGIYRVTSADLQNAGVNLGTIDPNTIHVYYRNREIPIHVQQGGGQIIDYLEFYGRRNDGRIDSMMYRDPNPLGGRGLHRPELAPNKRISLFSDTSAYFMTWDNVPGLRVTNYNNTNYNAYTPEPHFRYEAYKEYHPNTNSSAFNHGGGTRYDPYYLLNCDYITGEGYMHNRTFNNSANGGTSRVFTLSTVHSANNGPHEATVRYYNRSTQAHVIEVRVENAQQTNMQTLVEDTTYGVGIQTHVVPFNSYTLPNSTKIRFFAKGTQNNFTDNNNICWGALKYDHLLHMETRSSLVMHDFFKNSEAFFAFERSSITDKAWLWDLKNWTRSEGNRRGTDSLYAVIPGANNVRDIYIATDNGIKTPVEIVNSPDFGNLSDPNGGAPFVIITHRSLANSAIAYKNYRDTNTVNQLPTKIVFVDQIYEEFGFGSPTPWAIKQFCKYAKDRWNTKPKYFLLWGKGQYQIRSKPLNLVPTFGYPACDNEFVSNYDPDAINLTPETPIGRVNIYNNAEGMIYLEKIMEYEHTPWEPWMKEMILFGGGEDTLEQRPILNYLIDYQTRYEAIPFGGRAWYFQKYNTNIRTNSNLTSTEHINQGVGIIHFFGHSSNNIFDIDIALPSLYNNFGKYPLMIAFGCYGGEFTADDKSFGEKFVLEPGRGSIGYFANSTAGYLNPLGQYGQQLYPAAFRDHIGEAVGVQVAATIERYSDIFTDQLHNNHSKQLNYQGDPSLVLYYTPFPDLEITESSILFEPETFSASDDSFWVNIVTKNLGIVTSDSFYVSIRQETPSGNVLVHPTIKHPPIPYQDTIRYKIYNTEGNAMAGINYFDVFVDSTNIITEGNEGNNRVNYQAVVPGDVPATLHPFEYAVIDTANTYLAASAFIISQQANVNYIFQIDTVPEFSSPRLVASNPVNSSSNYARWDVPFAFEPNQVYYWRVRLANVYPVAWSTSSFKYLPGKTGWAQSEPPQFFKDATFKIHMDEIQREWEFDKKLEQLSVFNVQGSNEMQFRLAGFRSKSPGDYAARDGVHYAVIDGNTLQPNVQGTIIGDWEYSPTPVNVQQLVNTINNAKNGDYILICSVNEHRMNLWPPNAYQAMYQIGCSNNITTVGPSDMFIIVGRKGYPGSAVEILAPNVSVGNSGVNNFYDLNINLEGNDGAGNIQSTLIGPTVGWEDLIWDWSSLDPFVNENTTVDVYAVRPNSTDSLIYEDIEKGTYNLRMLDHARFPYMRLEARATDLVNYTAPQLDNWYVIYTPAPDAVADPVTHFEFLNDTVDEGEDISVSIASLNVTDPDMDSLLVKYTVRRADRSTEEVGLERYAPLPGQDRLDVSHTFNTAFNNFGGDATLLIELNPDNDQAEQYHFNNLFQYKFHVREDVINPIMDVTFDGKHIMDWDIVSPNPEILIEINDENPYLKVNDTAYTLYFGQGGLGSNLQLIHLGGNPLVERVPAELPDNKARLYFRPENLADGEYTLRVMGYDHKGNESGEVEYEIHFKVVNESSVSNILNYPNPFSTSTEFVYTLTGSEIPDVFRIDIYTITGKLVKSIDLAEMGDVKIGYTRTEYKWDGRDEFGDLLANGVYIYKVTVKTGDEEIKIRNEGIDNYFKNGIGKMYIMR